MADLHPLTRLLSDDHGSTRADKIITDYLTSRYKWAIKDARGPCRSMEDGLREAFELDEKCEHDYKLFTTTSGTGDPNIYCRYRCEKCGKEITTIQDKPHDPKPTLPSHLPNAWQTGDMMKVSMYLSEVAIKVNDLIDYLHSKEAREGV